MTAQCSAPLAAVVIGVAIAFGVAGCAGPAATPADEPPTLATLASRKVELPPDPGIRSSEAAATAAYRGVLETTREPAVRAEVMRRLADLEMDRADAQVAEGSATPDYRAARNQYERVLREHADARFNDRVLYQVARTQEQAGELEAALHTLTRLVSEYPRTPYRDEAYFRRGELLFATGNYASATVAYATVLGAAVPGAPRSPFTERALYMHGWSLYKQGKLDDALASFFRVLDIGLARLAPGPDPLARLTRGERELLEDTQRVTSLALASLQGAASIERFITDTPRRRYEHQVYIALAELYLKQERPKDAADTLSRYALAQPAALPAPELLARAIGILDQQGFGAPAIEARQDYVARYGRTSVLPRHAAGAWSAAQPRVKAYLGELARHHHASVQQRRDPAALQQAVHWYGEWLATFPDDADAGAERFLLAELLFEARRFAAAAAEYETVAYRHAKFAKAADAGYGALLAYAELAKSAGTAERRALQLTAVDGALRFARAFPDDARVGAVTTNAAESLLALGETTRAGEVARQALAARTGPNELRTALTVIGISAFERGQFAQAEQAFGDALARAAAGSAPAGDLAERRAAAAYQQGDQARGSGRMLEAIGHFERVATLAPAASAVRATAQFDAATARLGLSDWAGASAAFEEFRRQHPSHALQAEVPAKLALAYTEQRRWATAAAEFERVATMAATSELRRSAHWQAAALLGKAAAEPGAPRAAAQFAGAAYERYVQAWPQPLEPAIEARWQLVQLHKAQGQAPRALAAIRALREFELAGGEARTPRTRSLAALAALELTAPQLEAYRKIHLVEPLAANLKLKRARMETVLKAYAAAAEDGAIEGVTAATFHTAALYQDFGRALIGSQRPKKLKPAELEQYNVMLEEQAFPFEEKAITLHETNAKRSTQGLYDEWVRKSFGALAALKPVRWGKSERSEEAIDALR